MQTITRSRWMAFEVTTLYTVLTDSEKFAKIVKRINHLEVVERRSDDEGIVLAQLDLPGGKTLKTKGEVKGVLNQRLSFETNQPFPLEILWELQPENHGEVEGALVTYTVSMDLSPMVSFVPERVVKGYMSSEMDGDLKRLEDTVESTLAI